MAQLSQAAGLHEGHSPTENLGVYASCDPNGGYATGLPETSATHHPFYPTGIYRLSFALMFDSLVQLHNRLRAGERRRLVVTRGPVPRQHVTVDEEGFQEHPLHLSSSRESLRKQQDRLLRPLQPQELLVQSFPSGRNALQDCQKHIGMYLCRRSSQLGPIRHTFQSQGCSP
jgi:hypothetical protein